MYPLRFTAPADSYLTKFKTGYDNVANFPIVIYYTKDGTTPSCTNYVDEPAPDCIQKCPGTADFCKAFCVSYRIPAVRSSAYPQNRDLKLQNRLQ